MAYTRIGKRTSSLEPGFSITRRADQSPSNEMSPSHDRKLGLTRKRCKENLVMRRPFAFSTHISLVNRRRRRRRRRRRSFDEIHLSNLKVQSSLKKSYASSGELRSGVLEFHDPFDYRK